MYLIYTVKLWELYYYYDIDGSMQDCGISSALALKIL